MQTMNASEVRREFSSFIDKVIREKPVAFKRNRDVVLSVSREQMVVLLESFRFKAVFEEAESGCIIATLHGFDLIIEAFSKEAAIQQLSFELIDYANDYINDFNLYHNSINRKGHFPYVLKVLLAENVEEVTGFIDS